MSKANLHAETIVATLASLPQDPEQLSHIHALAEQLASSDGEWQEELLTHMRVLVADGWNEMVDRGLELVLTTLVARQRNRFDAPMDPGWSDSVVALYLELPTRSRARNWLLGWLAALGSDQSLSEFARLVADHPPENETTLVAAFSPLIDRGRRQRLPLLFPVILDGLQHRTVAAAILDIANFSRREGLMSEHPAVGRADELDRMLGRLAEQLHALESGKVPGSRTPAEISRTVNECVSLIASLCDCLGLIGQQGSAAPLRQAALLKHRRIRAEALAALCRLGDAEAPAELAALAAEPVARLRVLAYARELGLLDRVEEKYRSDAARAESELATWLALPVNMGLAPTTMELIDQRNLAWPGLEEEVECFLFRYRYELAGRSIENIGIAGPMTHAFSLPLSELTLDDVYAAFAGWQVQHEEIGQWPPEQADAHSPGIVPRLLSRLASEQLDGLSAENVQPTFVGQFLGTWVLVAAAERHGVQGCVAVDRDDVMWLTLELPGAPGLEELAWSIYKGRRLLAAFNRLARD